MKEFNDINKKDYLYDTDSNLIFNSTPEQVEYIYTLNQQETTEVLTVKQLNTKLKLTIQSVECCQSLEKDPILLILTNDQEKTIRIFFYRVFTKQATEVTMTYPAIQQDISKASITQDPFNVSFMDKKASKTESGYGLVLGLVTGVTLFILIRINWNSFEATCLSMERMEQKKNSDLGYVTAIQILPPDKEDKRMGHSDPQILLGYSQGAILVYRYRTKIYVINAKRLRTPVDLSEFTEFPKYPISCLSGVRSYHSLGMTIAFAQQKPSNNKKYEHSRSYVKIVETHGDSTRKQRKIMYSDHPDAMILKSKLLLTPFKTHDLESIIQLSIVLINKKKSFELEVWHIAPKNLRQSDKFEVNQDKCLALLPGRKLSSDNLLEYLQHTPQKLAQAILEYEHTKSSSSSTSSKKRKVGLVVDEEKEEEKVSRKKAKTNQEDRHTPQELAQVILEPEHSKSSLMKRTVELVVDEEEEEKMTRKKVKTDQEEDEDINIKDPEHTVLLNEPEGRNYQDISMPVETNKCLYNIVPEGSAEDTQSSKHHQEQPDPLAEHHQEQLEQSTTSDDNSVKESKDQYLNPIPEPVVLIDNVSHTNESSPEPKSNESDIEESSIKDMEIENNLALNDLVIQAMEEANKSIEGTNVENTDQRQKDVKMMQEVILQINKNPKEEIDDGLEQQQQQQQLNVNESTKTILEELAELDQNQQDETFTEPANDTVMEDTDTIVQQVNQSTMIDSVNEESATTIEKTTYTKQITIEESNTFVNETTIQEEAENQPVEAAQNDVELESNDRQPSEETSILESSLVENDQESFIDLGLTEAEDNNILSSELSSDNLVRQVSEVPPETNVKTTMAIKGEDATVVSQSSDVEETSQINYFDQVSESSPLLPLQSDDMDTQDSEVEEYFTPEATLNSGMALHSEEEEEEGERQAIFVDDGDYYDASAELSLQVDGDHSYLPESTEDVESVTDVSFNQRSPTIESVTSSRDETSVSRNTTPFNESGDLSLNTPNAYIPASSLYTLLTPDAQFVTNSRDVTPVTGLYPEDSREDIQEITQLNVESPVTSENYDIIYLPTSRDTTPGQNSRNSTPGINSQRGTLLRSISDLGRLEEMDYASISQDTTSGRSMDTTTEENGDKRAAAAAAAEAGNEEKESNLKLSEEKFTQILYEVTGETNMDNFMEEPLVPRKQLDNIGLLCWSNPDPRLKLIFIRYCDKHELGSFVIPLCYLLRGSMDSFIQDEQDEYKAIYKKHLINYPMYNEDINVFTKKGRQELLRKEMLYYRNGSSSNRYNTTNTDAVKNSQIFINYYGFGSL